MFAFVSFYKSVFACVFADCTICSDFSALSLMSLIFPKSCWMAIWASSKAYAKKVKRVV